MRIYVIIFCYYIIVEGPEGKLRPNNPNVCTTENINLTCTVESVSYTSADIRFNISNTRVPENKTAVVDGSSKNITLTNVTMADYNANILCCVAPCNQPNHIVEGQLLEVYGEYKYTIKVIFGHQKTLL